MPKKSVIGSGARVLGGKNEVNKKGKISIKPPPKQDGWLVEDCEKSLLFSLMFQGDCFILLCSGYVELL